MKEITLTQGKIALVDDADFEWLNQWNWCASRETHSQLWYAARTEIVDGRRFEVKMHRLILGLVYGDSIRTDHRNGDRLDNQRHNLRIATASQNAMNSKFRVNNTSGFKGVHRQKNRWRATICKKFLGSFLTPEEAHRAYKQAACKIFGDFARVS